MIHYSLDFETYSAADLRAVGAYRYACDPSTRILLCAIAYGLNPPLCWDSRDPDGEESRAALRLIQECSSSSETVAAHNAPFEIAISTCLWEATFGCPMPALDRWRCTAAMCRRAAIPWSLAGAADFLRLDHKKDKAGGRLIQIFSVPQKKEPKGTKVTVAGVKMTEEEAWAMFRDYCRNDVVTEREIHQRMKAYELTGDALRSFQFDLRMNHLGVPVDVPALEQAQAIVEEYGEQMKVEFVRITGLSPSQTGATLAWLKERGYPGEDLTADTMEWALTQPMGPEAKRALQIRASLSFAATKKISAMLECVCPDGRVRGAFMWYGAVRTGRWSGRLVQFQNVKRPTINDTDVAYDVVACGAGLDALSSLYESPLEALASIVRNFVREETGDFIDLDLANIEGRVAGWLAGDDELLDQFRAGVDVYKIMGARVFDIAVEDVGKQERAVGKEAILSCGYGVGWPRFQTMAAGKGVTLDDETAKLTVFKYRKARKAIVGTWKDFGDAAVGALREPGATYKAGEFVSFRYGKTGGFTALTMTLPSGRRLVYPDPRVETREITAEVLKEDEQGEIISETVTFKTESISFYGQNATSSHWSRVDTHGSKLFENACQATAGDFLTHGLLLAEGAGYQICSVIHDQALAKHSPETGHTLEKFLELMTRVPEWATGFPLKAEAHIAPCYSK